MARKSKAEAAKRNVNPDDEAACYADYEELRGEASRVGQRIASMLERYKKMGVDTVSIKRAYAEAQKDDAQERHEAFTAMLVRLNVITWDEAGQANFDKALDTGVMSEDGRRMIGRGRAKAAGYKAGNSGMQIDANPFDAGTEEHVCWVEQFHAGHAQRVEDGKGDVVKATPRKRTSREERVAAREAEIEGVTIN